MLSEIISLPCLHICILGSHQKCLYDRRGSMKQGKTMKNFLISGYRSLYFLLSFRKETNKRTYKKFSKHCEIQNNKIQTSQLRNINSCISRRLKKASAFFLSVHLCVCSLSSCVSGCAQQPYQGSQTHHIIYLSSEMYYCIYSG